MSTLPEPLAACAKIARDHGVELLLLFGSRARDQAHAASDWDFATLVSDPLGLDALAARLTGAVGSDAVDLVDLGRAGGLIRFHAARDGLLVHESFVGAHHRFRMQATLFWCDAQPLIAREYQRLLGRLQT